MNTKIFLVAVAIGILLNACSAEKKLARLIKNHPELTRIDTLTVKDTTIIASIKTDTLFKHTASKDTAYIYKDRLKIKYVNDGDTVFISGECEGDTIYKEILVPVTKVVNVESDCNTWYLKAIIAGLSLLVAYLVFQAIRR